MAGSKLPPRPASSRVTAKGQTTLPKPVRNRLNIADGGCVAVRLHQDGVTIQTLPAEALQDAMLAPFLALLQADIAQHPASSQPAMLSSDSVWQNIRSSHGDFDRPIAGPVAL